MGKLAVFPWKLSVKLQNHGVIVVVLISSALSISGNFLVQNYFNDEKVPFLRTYAWGQTDCMLFGTCPKLALSTSFSIAIDGKALNRVSEYKYLGGFLDASLIWNAHVDYLIGKVRKWLAMLGWIRKNISIYTASTIYTSFVLPILDYCDTVWSCCWNVTLMRSEKLQRRAARIVMRLGTSEKALNFLGYETLEKRRESHVRSLVKNC